MIKATFYRRDGYPYGFQVTGHAEYAEEGKDIVCSAVSALVENTINSLETFTSDSIVSRVDEDGSVRVKIRGEVSPESELLLKSLRLGLCKIYDQYGDDYITVFLREVKS